MLASFMQGGNCGTSVQVTDGVCLTGFWYTGLTIELKKLCLHHPLRHALEYYYNCSYKSVVQAPSSVVFIGRLLSSALTNLVLEPRY